jgi:dTDP-4-amino-4,6-dideoxygalactose transaminase
MSDELALSGGPPVRSTFLPYARHLVDRADIAAVTEALAGDWLTQGPRVARFEQALASFTGARHAVAVANGTAALHAALTAGAIGPGEDVITTPLTFAATANVVALRGARPVFADIDARTLNVDPAAVAAVATPRTRALLAVDFAGLPCDWERLGAIAAEHGWLTIDDAAHAFGARRGTRAVGTLADLTTLSFHPAKLITTGEGGAVLTDRDELAARVRRLRHHGIEFAEGNEPWRYDIEAPGYNYRLTDFQCALGLSQLGKIEGFAHAREVLAHRYRQQLLESPFVEVPALPPDDRHAWHLFVVLLRLERLRADRDTVIRALRAENIGAQLLYPLVHRFHAFAERFGYRAGLCPVAEAVERRLVALPLFPAMTKVDQDDVLTALDKVFHHLRR